MTDEDLEGLARRVKEATTREGGKLPRAIREAASSRAEARARGIPPGDTMPADLAAFVDAIANRPLDADVEGLLASGKSEDDVFEITVAAAAGAGLLRTTCGLAAIRRRS